MTANPQRPAFPSPAQPAAQPNGKPIVLPKNWNLREPPPAQGPTPASEFTPQREPEPERQMHKDVNCNVKPLAMEDVAVLRKSILQMTRRSRIPEASVFDLEQEMFIPRRDRNEEPSAFNRPPSAAEIVKTAWFESQLTLEDLLPYRVHITWRLTREIGRIRGLVHKDTSLRNSLAPLQGRADPFNFPQTYTGHQPSHKDRPPSDTVSRLLSEADEVTGEARFSLFDARTFTETYFNGLPMLPPPVPRKDLKVYPGVGLMPSDEYDPHDDVMLMYFLDIAKELVEEFHMEGGSIEDNNLGRFGLAGLLHPYTARVAWPTPEELYCWEDMLVTKTINMIGEESTARTRQALVRKYGLTDFEANNLIILSKQGLHDGFTGDMEVERSLMVLRLENLIERAKEALDLRAEMLALKQLAVVQGFSRMEEGNDKDDIMATIKRVAAVRSESRPVIQATNVRAIGDGNDAPPQ